MEPLRFPSFTPGLRTVVIGGGGIGAAVHATLSASPDVGEALLLSRRPGADGAIDVMDPGSVAKAAEAVDGPLDLVFVATGVLQGEGFSPEKSLSALSAEALAKVYAINAIGPAIVAQQFLPKLAKGRKTVFAALSARVGSIEDNRLGGWHAYRASKAALNQLIRTMSIELARRNPEALCVALHPGTVATDLSAPFQRGVPEGKLFSPETSANALLTVLEGLTRDDSGGLFAWDGARIPF